MDGECNTCLWQVAVTLTKVTTLQNTKSSCLVLEFFLVMWGEEYKCGIF